MYFLQPPGFLGAAVLPGPDAGEGALTESHSPGTPPAPLPQAVGTPFLHCPPHETLPPPLSCWPNPPSSTLKTHTYCTHATRVAVPSPSQNTPPLGGTPLTLTPVIVT